ncbi:MAG TPA: cobalamin-binding protein [Terriglobia bacterium]|jgi:iron complex transport system substrate-binding protein|nr:cobalamin-binding protein [Terriglobia bacterium]
MRICSFLPSATEILFALGLGDSVMGVTFECDHPPEARGKPVVVCSNLAQGLSEREIDRQVKMISGAGQSLYRLDVAKLREIGPDLIVTQDLCHVCAASPADLGAVLAQLPAVPEVIALSPRTLADVWGDILRVGQATGREREASRIVRGIEDRIRAIQEARREGDPPRVLCLEWLDPPFVAGHWVPEMVTLAGGIDVLGRAGEPGYEVDWPAAIASAPEVVLVMPCGYHKPEVEEELRKILFPARWQSMPAVRNGRVFAVDASAYFSRPGPRLVEGIAVMADVFAGVTSAIAGKTA